MLSARLKRWVLVATLVVLTTAYALYRIRERQIQKLYEEICGVPPSFRGTEDAVAAVKKLGTYRGDQVTDMLLNIALGGGVFPWPSVQREAMIALSSRHDPRISKSLASLLQPHVGLATRQAAAEALRTIPCSDDCIKSILHYLERMSWGEPNLEDRTIGLNERVKARLTNDQEALYQTLYAVLKHEPRLTIVALHDVYGLATDSPSAFGLTLPSRMQFREACAAILESERLLKGSAGVFNAPEEDLRATLASLKCR